MPTSVARQVAPEVERFIDRIEEGYSSEHAYPTLLGLRTFDVPGLHARLQEGLSYRSLERIQRTLNLSSARLSELVQIPLRTLARRKEAGRLEPDESDRLVRITRLIGKALVLFEGDLDATRDWLTRPQMALGGSPPVDYAKTDVGAREVERLIGRLEHGIAG